ncbi:hypothetical protein JCM8547_004385 [Rhodosporidiobolus lusitaniae]
MAYTYEFVVNGVEPYGTYCAHRSGYYADGISGPFIVHGPDDPLVRGVDYDIDQIVLFEDCRRPFAQVGPRQSAVRRGTGTLNASQAATIPLNLTNPLRRDTIGVAPGTWVLVRIVTDIPGVHAFHCHILFH